MVEFKGKREIYKEGRRGEGGVNNYLHGPVLNCSVPVEPQGGVVEWGDWHANRLNYFAQAERILECTQAADMMHFRQNTHIAILSLTRPQI